MKHLVWNVAICHTQREFWGWEWHQICLLYGELPLQKTTRWEPTHNWCKAQPNQQRYVQAAMKLETFHTGQNWKSGAGTGSLNIYRGGREGERERQTGRESTNNSYTPPPSLRSHSALVPILSTLKHCTVPLCCWGQRTLQRADAMYYVITAKRPVLT